MGPDERAQGLTLPGTIPGLLRRCSPVVCPDFEHVLATIASLTEVYAIVVERWTWEHQQGERDWGIVHGHDPNTREMQWWAPYEDFGCGIVPGLATLDPDDSRLLADGSRWVDAEALRLVCLHVAGVTP